MLLIINNLQLPTLRTIINIIPTPDENKPANILGNFYKKLFGYLHQALQIVIADLERSARSTTIWNNQNDLLTGKIVPSAGMMEYQVMGSENNLYYVLCCEGREEQDDLVSCTCPDFQFRGRECKHIKAVRAYKNTLLSLPLEQQIRIVSKGNQIATARRNAYLATY